MAQHKSQAYQISQKVETKGEQRKRYILVKDLNESFRTKHFKFKFGL